MLCNQCKKRDAKVLYTEIINGIKKEQHLCEECATGVTSFQLEKPNLKKEFTLGDILSTMLHNYYMGEQLVTDSGYSKLICKSCNKSYEDFIYQGRFGCAQCYREFYSEIGKTLKGMQGSDIHTGKRPKGFETASTNILTGLSEIDKLEITLQKAIEKEEFEEAVKLRDTIRELKKEENNSNA